MRKVTAVLADDEPLILKGLGKLISWEAYGIEIVSVAYDGKELMEQIERHKPDIVISDISMPHVTGIDMLKEVKRRQLAVKVIFVSAFQEFTYARDAVAYGAVDYLVKPIKKGELEAVLERTLLLIREANEEGDIRNKLKLLERKSKDDELDSSLEQLSEGTLAAQSEALGRLRQRFAGPRHTIGIVSIDPVGHDDRRWPSEAQKLVEFAVLNVVNECLQPYGEGIVFMRKGRHVFLLNHDEGISMEQTGDDIRSHIRQYLKLSVSVGLGHAVSDLLDVRLSYRQASEALQMTYFRGLNRTVVYGPANRRKDSENEWFTMKSGIVKALTEGNWQQASGGMKSLLHVMGEATIGSPQLAVSACFTSLLFIVQEVKNSDVPMSDWGFEIADLQQRLEHCVTYEALCDDVMDMLEQLYERIGDKTVMREHSLINRIVDYINGHYTDNISLESVAAVAFMNPYYFSSFFKKHMKRNFKQYVTDLRIAQAEELLARTDLMVYEIAEKVGYNNARHFSDMFKKHTGALPHEFRSARRE